MSGRDLDGDEANSEEDSEEANPKEQLDEASPELLPGENLEADASQESGTDRSLIQFSASMFIALETEGFVTVEVLRMGNANVRSQVHYTTSPGTAKEGKHYERSAGVLEFEEGEIEKQLQIPVKQIKIWKLTTEFSVHLLPDPAPVNAALSPYLRDTRVKILDTSTFPANHFKKMIDSGLLHSYNYKSLGRLLLGYIRWNWRHSEKIRRGTMKMLLLASLENLYVLLKLCIKLILVDVVLVHGNVDNPLQYLIAGAILTVVPFGVVHFLETRELTWGVGGQSRTILQKALMRKFLNYEEEKREDLQSGDLVMTMTRDVDNLVTGGYGQMVMLWQSAGKLTVLVVYQGISPWLVGESATSIQRFPLVLTCLFPVFLFGFLLLRANITTKHVEQMDTKQDAMASQVGRIFANYRMIADYGRRPFFEDRFDDRIKDYNKSRREATLVLKNNKKFPAWISTLSFAAYVIYGGLQVLGNEDGSLSLGLFVTTLDLLGTMGTAWQEIYTILLEMQGSFPALTMVVSLLNRPTNIERRMVAGRAMRNATRRTRNTLRATISHLPTGDEAKRSLRVDMMQIKVADLKIHYNSKMLHASDHCLHLPGELCIDQGQLVCLVGPKGEGKSTVLKVLGGMLFSSSGTTFIPAHLRLLHVSHEPMFFSGSLYENLVFGCAKGHPDAAVDRVARVCRRLGIPEDLVAEVSKGNDGKVCLWREVLSHSYKCLFNLARALVTNPEVLILHKPMMGVDESMTQDLVKLFREFCEQRGIEQDPAKVHLRRPRTCIFTCSRSCALRAADQSYLISADSGIRALEGKALAQLQENSFRSSDLKSVDFDGIARCEKYSPMHL